MSFVVKSTTSQPSVAAEPWPQSATFPGDTTNSGQVTRLRAPRSGVAAISVEETQRFAEAHYDRALRRLAD